jgi:cytochrome oxidase assembly protein ShyY1
MLFFACAIVLLLLRLGFWQLERADEKQQQIVQMQESVSGKQALNLAQLNPTTKQIEWAQGRVQFLSKPIILLDNQRNGQQVGVTVYQLAKNQNQQVFLVDLGWLPVSNNRTFPKTKALNGEYTVAGLLMPAPAAGFALGQAVSSLDANTLLVTRLDIGQLSKQLAQPLASRVLRLDPALPIGFERSLTVSSNTLPPEKHRAYAFQWFGLALAFFCLCLYVLKRKKYESTNHR